MKRPTLESPDYEGDYRHGGLFFPRRKTVTFVLNFLTIHQTHIAGCLCMIGRTSIDADRYLYVRFFLHDDDPFLREKKPPAAPNSRVMRITGKVAGFDLNRVDDSNNLPTLVLAKPIFTVEDKAS